MYGVLEEIWLIRAMEGEREDIACTKPLDTGIRSLRTTQPAEIFHWGF
jgi:hypothetical protein